MRRNAKIKQIIAQIDTAVHHPDVRSNQLLKDALYNYRDSLVQEFYNISATIKPQPKKEPLT